MSNERLFGIHAVSMVLKRGPRRARQLWLLTGRDDQRVAEVRELAIEAGVKISQASRAELDAMVEGNHQGAVLEASPAQALDEKALMAILDKQDATPFLLVLDGVTDPHNLGACLRSADAAGVDAVIVPKDNAASLTPAVRKVACGAAETVPFVTVTNLARTLDKLKERGVWLAGAAGEASQSIYQSDFTGSLAIVMGAEGAGLRRLTRERCDFLINIPMAGTVSSLNVSVATGVCLFEAVRQRQSQQKSAIE
ncbi:MAG: 23S rRNA (guanosine(2251)-2'-O)-methyltransferase RlmB [Pseudomonadales bacterium]